MSDNKQLAVVRGRCVYILSPREAAAWHFLSDTARDKLIAKKEAAGEYEVMEDHQ